MQVTDNRKRRKRSVVKKIRVKIRKYAIILSLLLAGTAILGVLISHFFSYDTKIEKNFYTENEHVNQNEINDRDANRVMRLAGEFFEKRIDEIRKLSKK